VCLITPDTIYCSNAGDSRAVLGLKNGKFIELSHDHKPDNDGEMKRIKEGGGFVEDGRVQGVIAVSRAIGDWEYKNPGLQATFDKKTIRRKKAGSSKADGSPTEVSKGPYRNIEESKKHQVTAFPDVKKVPFKPADHDFIICACDGIWDCFTNEQAIKYIRQKREKGPKNSASGGLKNKSQKSVLSGSSKTTGLNNSPLKMSKGKSEASSPTKKVKNKGETSFIIEEMMDQGIAKGDITMSDGTGTDNMTCVII
jgi:serine/threonine protein phosphatase PrpC